MRFSVPGAEEPQSTETIERLQQELEQQCQVPVMLPACINVTDLITAIRPAEGLDPAEVERTISTLSVGPPCLRALRVRGPHDRSGPILIPSSPTAAAAAIARLLSEPGETAEFFVILNPAQIGPHALIDQWNSGEAPTVTTRRWILFDVDPDRPKGTNSTAAELAASAGVATRLIEHLSGAGWPEPVVALSGNGVHVLYRVELPAGAQYDHVVRDTLIRAATLFDTVDVRIDRVVWDIGRLVRLYGTENRKGPHTAERPRRWSRFLFVPSQFSTVNLKQLRTFCEHVPRAPRASSLLEELRLKRRLTLEELLEFFEVAESTSGGWMVHCPAHLDRTPSLSISEGQDRLLIHCFAGCDSKEILDTVGLHFRQLFLQDQSPSFERPAQQIPHSVNLELEAYAAHCRAHATPDILGVLANALRLPFCSLQWIGVGWDPVRQAWTFPECRHDGRIVGVMLRYLDHRKWCMPGSHRGLILPWGWQQFRGPVLVPEGATDVAALLSTGRQAIGRPSAMDVGDLPLMASSLPIEPIILGENDQRPDGSWPGRAGAMRCTEQLAAALMRPVEFNFPAAGHKDVRDAITSTWSTAAAAIVIHQGVIAQNGQFHV